MTYLEILSWAKKGMRAEKEKLRDMQERAAAGGAGPIVRGAQEQIDAIEVKEATLAEIEELHNRE